MRGRFFIIFSLALMLGLLVALNAASYVRVEQPPDLEFAPDRSTSNAGATGTRALFEFLESSGYRVARWRETPGQLFAATGKGHPTTFVVIGPLRRAFAEQEAERLLFWVSGGGRLILIDREPDAALLPLPATGALRLAAQPPEQQPPSDLRADNVDALTAGVQPIKPAQPTLLTNLVAQLAPSRFASRLAVHALSEDEPEIETEGVGQAKASSNSAGANEEASGADEEAAAAKEGETQYTPPLAPVLHFTDERGALVADYRYGLGRIAVLSDPFIVANNGISRADNLQLAVNLLTGGANQNDAGLIVFDEYHQGRGATHNQLLSYFAGTPVLAAGGQLALLALAVVWSRGRRFARPLPAPRVDRRSKLEFVASMAELQQRARAYDLAIENVYGRTRRALVRYAGTDNSVPRAVIAERVAARAGTNRNEIEQLMRACEEAINGQPISAKESLKLIARLRQLEHALGITMRAREIKQAEML